MSNYTDQRGPDLRDQFQQDYREQQNQLAQQKTKKRVWLIGAIVLAAILLMGGCSSYNSLNSEREQVRAAFANVDVQLQRRADLIPNYVNTVKGYVKHEEQVFNEIAEARARMVNPQASPNEKVAADNQLTTALGRLFVITENYPDLKANQSFMRLQDELAGTENRVGTARRDYNNKATEYNTMRQRFPTVIPARLFGFDRAELFQASEASRQAPQVPGDFSK